MSIDIYVEVEGDPSVGIPDATFTIENIGDLDDVNRALVRVKFAEAFGLLYDMPIKVLFSDEIG